jgi:hypothetical protein
METVIVAALVSGLVSLVGLLVNLRVAREQSRTTESMPSRESIARVLDSQLSALRSFATEGERLRIRMWDLLGRMSGARHMEALFPSDIQDIGAKWDALREQAVRFDESWAEIKSDIPQGVQMYIRALRHECREEVADIGQKLSRVVKSDQAANAGEDRFAALSSVLAELENDTKSVLAKLDTLIQIAGDFRARLIAETTNNRIESDK